MGSGGSVCTDFAGFRLWQDGDSYSIVPNRLDFLLLSKGHCIFMLIRIFKDACSCMLEIQCFSEQLKTVAFLARRSVRPDSTVGTLVKAVLFEWFIHWVFFADGRSSAASLHWLFPEKDGGGRLL
ncbi:hypothetical protein DY000_02062366 [Brassica cretica]|uniref:Uncharacterized protein n=1 Tax=Brassica cretica TaxID=69181 RepID=A0ABQ7B1M5_BRACR|nr:hypothetical protein DY000_02062366 [Brassica cretica]